MKRTLIVLLAALAMLAAILFKKNRNETSMRADAPVLDSARKSEVAYLRTAKKPDTATLGLKDGKWVVAKDGFSVDTAKIKKVLGHIFSLQDREKVSNSPDRLKEYGLDSAEAKHVSVQDGSGKSMAEVVIGKTSGTDFSSTYWKWADKPEVYRTPGNFTWEIAVKEDEWKDRKLFAATIKDIRSIETIWTDSTGAAFSYKLEATSDSTWKMLAPQDSNRVKTPLATEMAGRFADMSIDEFVSPTDSNVAQVKPDSPAVWIKVTLKSGAVTEIKAGKVLGGFAYAPHPVRKELVKLAGWRFDAFKKKPFELLDAPPVAKADSAVAKPALSGTDIKIEPAPAGNPPAKAPAKQP